MTMQALTNTEVLARFKAIFDDNKAPIYNTISNEMFTIPTFMDDPQTPLQHMKHYTYHMRCIPIAFGLEYGYIPVNKWNESPSNRSHGVLDPLVFHLKASTWEKQIPNTLPNRRADAIKKYANTWRRAKMCRLRLIIAGSMVFAFAKATFHFVRMRVQAGARSRACIGRT